MCESVLCACDVHAASAVGVKLGAASALEGESFSSEEEVVVHGSLD